MNEFVQVVAIASPEDYRQAVAAAKADSHQLYAPTHTFKRGGEIVGAVSLASCVLAMPWFHTQRMGRRDSFGVINSLQNSLRMQKVSHVCIPVGPQSPFNKVMAPLGFTSLGYWNFHACQL